MSFFSILADYAKYNPDKSAFLAYGHQPINYFDLHRLISQLASQLKNAGISSTDTVIITLPNGPELALINLSVMAVATAAPTNPDCREAEYSAMFEQIKPRLLITLAGIDHPAKNAALAANVRVFEVEVQADAPAGSCRFVGVEQPDYNQDVLLNPPALDSLALILQTSGTTSLPKIVPLTHSNLLASARNLQQSLQLAADDCVLHFLPMYHIGGIVDVLLAPLISGGSVVCCKSFSTPEFFRDLQYYKPTWVQAVPIMTEEILSVKEDYDSAIKHHTLKFLRSVSAPLPVSLMQAFEEVFRIPVIEIFGMTETAGVITSNPLPPKARKPGSVGVPAGTEVRIMDEAGRPLPANKLGQVVVNGRNVMSGYQNDPETNAQLMVNGALCTGDIGYLDSEGYLFLVGRIKDIINRGGEKISPLEVDRTLLAHPSVADAACFPIPHPSLGEDIAAVVVMKKGSLFDADLLSYLWDQLAYFKVPRLIKAVDQIPRNNGKLQRARLAELFAPMMAAVEPVKADFVAPQLPVEKMIAQIWEKILKTQPIGINDNFFEIGGDSLKAASFINAMQQEWGETIYVSSIFDAPTIASYEYYLRQHYPEVHAKMLGISITLKQHSSSPVTTEMIETLRATIAHPAPKLRPAVRKNPRAIFVLSAPRSGSTLLRVMLAGNPKIFSPPELYLLSFDTMADRRSWYSGSQRFQLEGNIRALLELRDQTLEEAQKFITELEDANVPVQDYYRMLQEWLGDRILVDKTPAYAIDIETLKRAEDYFENPYYIHLVRHPYGMIRSFEEAKLEQLWYPRLVGGDKAAGLDALPYNRRQLAEMIWFILNENIVKFLRDIPSQRHTFLRFEDLVNQPEKEMREICDKLGIAYASGMVNPQQEKKNRMTDGIHQSSRMIGDPKFHQHNKIDPSIADLWKSAYEIDFLAEESLQLARDLGYEETVATVLQRTELDL